MKAKVDWEKPIRFVKVQDDNHADYVPRYVGSFMNDAGKRRHVVCTRHWDHAVSFAVYNDDGELLEIENNKNVTNASGIFNATIVNGDPITTERVDVRGAWVDVTFDGDKAVKSRIIR